MYAINVCIYRTIAMNHTHEIWVQLLNEKYYLYVQHEYVKERGKVTVWALKDCMMMWETKQKHGNVIKMKLFSR